MEFINWAHCDDETVTPPSPLAKYDELMSMDSSGFSYLDSTSDTDLCESNTDWMGETMTSPLALFENVLSHMNAREIGTDAQGIYQGDAASQSILVGASASVHGSSRVTKSPSSLQKDNKDLISQSHGIYQCDLLFDAADLEYGSATVSITTDSGSLSHLYYFSEEFALSAPVDSADISSPTLALSIADPSGQLTVPTSPIITQVSPIDVPSLLIDAPADVAATQVVPRTRNRRCPSIPTRTSLARPAKGTGSETAQSTSAEPQSPVVATRVKVGKLKANELAKLARAAIPTRKPAKRAKAETSKEGKWPCPHPNCDQMIGRSGTDVERHVLSAHPTPHQPQLMCGECDTMFKGLRQDSLKRHHGRLGHSGMRLIVGGVTYRVDIDGDYEDDA